MPFSTRRNKSTYMQQKMNEAAFDVPAPMVERAFQLLDVLMVSDEGLALSDLARSLNMSKGSMHRLLKTLEHCGVVELHEEHLYVLGPRIYKLASYVRGAGLRRLALPAMQRLVTAVGETTFLGRVEQDSVHVLESLEAEESISFRMSRFREEHVCLYWQAHVGNSYLPAGRQSDDGHGCASIPCPASPNTHSQTRNDSWQQ